MPSPTTSSSATSPAEPSPVVLGDYRPEESDEALALERACAQGTSYRLSFRRETFHRRAENFAVHQLFTARAEGRLVGVVAVAVKRAELWGSPVRAAFGFDLRVHPSFRRRGLGRRLFQRALEWGMARADLAYTYAVAGNRAALEIAASLGRIAGGYAYLVYPVHRKLAAERPLALAGVAEVHAEMRRVEGPFDFYCDPLVEGRMGGHVASWICQRGASRAGCSAWSNRGILGEVVESIPLPLRLLGRAVETAPLRRLRLPRIPRPGEELRSWYLFDFFSTDEAAARDLARGVAAEALDRGIDWLYLPFGLADPRLRSLRADVPRLFAPAVGYRLVVHRPGGLPAPIERLYVDVRDL